MDDNANQISLFSVALVLINGAIAWAAVAFVPRVPANFSYGSESNREIKEFFLTRDWGTIGAIVGIAVLLTIAVRLILASYGKLPPPEKADRD